MLVKDAWVKLKWVFGRNDALFLLMPVSAVVCALQRDRFWRVQAVILPSFLLAFLVIRGGRNVARFYSISYPMAALAFGLLADKTFQRLSSRSQLILFSALFCAAVYTHGRAQFVWGDFRTLRWPYKPVLTSEQKLAYARIKETGAAYAAFDKVRPYIPDDATVLLVDQMYPYYLKRHAYWADQVTRPILGHWWTETMDATAAADDLRRRGIDYVMSVQFPYVDPRLVELETRGDLTIVYTGDHGIRGDHAQDLTIKHTPLRLWRVNASGKDAAAGPP
jgi:hypothetical protein